MTTGNVLYLLMVVGMFVSFSIVLAYQSWHQSRLEQFQPDWNSLADNIATEFKALERADRFQSA